MSDQLIVKANSWHYRVYTWWLAQSGAKPKTLNLCPYMRAVLLWAPLHGVMWLVGTFLRILIWPFKRACRLTARGRRFLAWTTKNSHWLFLGFMATMLGLSVIAQILDDGWWEALWFVLILAGAICAIALIVAASIFSCEWWHRRSERHGASSGASARKLGWEWVKAKKRRICPTIKVEE